MTVNEQTPNVRTHNEILEETSLNYQRPATTDFNTIHLTLKAMTTFN